MTPQDVINKKIAELNKWMGTNKETLPIAKKLQATPDTTIKGVNFTPLPAGLGKPVSEVISSMPGAMARSYGKTVERVATPEGRQGMTESLFRVAKDPFNLKNLSEPIVEDAANLADAGVLSAPGLTIKTLKNGAKDEGLEAIHQIARNIGKLKGDAEMYLGKGAKGFDAAKAEGKTFTAAHDGKERFEIDDSKAKLTPKFNDFRVMGQDTTLGEILDHPELYENYPDMKNMPVKDKDMGYSTTGSYAPYSDKLNLNTKALMMGNEDPLDVTLHEGQHAIQDKEKFAAGGSQGSILETMPSDKAPNKFARAVQLEKKLKESGYNWEDSSELNGIFDELNQMSPQEKFDFYKRVAGEWESNDVVKRRSLDADMRSVIPPYSSDPMPTEMLHSRPTDKLIADAGMTPEEYKSYIMANENTVVPGAMTEPINDPARQLPAPKPFSGFSDYTTKTLKALKGKTDISKQQVIDQMNKLNVRPVERSLIEEALAKYEGHPKISVKGLAEETRNNPKFPKFESKEAGSQWQDYSLGEQLGWDTDYSVHTMHTPFEWNGGQNFHFSNGEGQLYHTRREDMQSDKFGGLIGDEMKKLEDNTELIQDGTGMWTLVDKETGSSLRKFGDDKPEDYSVRNEMRTIARERASQKDSGSRVISEVQSDLMQENKYKRELPPTAEELTNKHTQLTGSAQELQDRAERRQLLVERLPQIMKNEGLVPGVTLSEQPAFKKFAAVEIPRKQALEPDASLWRLEDQTLDEWAEGLAKKYGVEQRDFSNTVGYSENLDDTTRNLQERAANELTNAKAQTEEAQAIQAKLDAGMPLSPEEQAKKNFFDTYKGDKWWEFAVRDEINKAAKAGKDDVLFPKGDTVAKIEQYVKKGEEGAIEHGDYDIGDTVYNNWEGDNMTVLDTDGNSVLAAPQDKVRSYEASDFLDDERSHYLDDFESYKEDFVANADESLKRKVVEALGEEVDDVDEVVAAMDEIDSSWRDDAAEKMVENNIGSSDYDVKRYLEDMGDGHSYYVNNGTIYDVEGEPDWHDMGDSEGGYPEDIRGELGSDQSHVYDFYNDTISKYLKKIQHLGKAEDTYVDGEAFTKFTPHPSEKSDGTEVFGLAPMALGGALVGGGVAAQSAQQKQNQRYQ